MLSEKDCAFAIIVARIKPEQHILLHVGIIKNNFCPRVVLEVALH
jgi:hypothetical protein